MQLGAGLDMIDDAMLPSWSGVSSHRACSMWVMGAGTVGMKLLLTHHKAGAEAIAKLHVCHTVYKGFERSITSWLSTSYFVSTDAAGVIFCTLIV